MTENNYKTWTKTFLASVFFFICIAGGFVFIVDPFQQYKKPWSIVVDYSLDQRHLAAGMAKSMEYDIFLAGSSMTENFLAHEIDSSLGGKSVKLCVSGASGFELKNVMENALRIGKTKKALVCLDMYAYLGKPDRLRYGPGSFPLYLYDSSYLNDFKYLISLDTLGQSFKSISNILTKKKLKSDPDKAFCWGEKFKGCFGRIQVLSAWKERKSCFATGFKPEDFTLEALKKNFDINFLEVVKKYPEVRFYVFLPPYSILTWLDTKEKGWLGSALGLRSHIFESLSAMPNVEVHDFQADRKITFNIDKYKDMTHYSPEINSFILKAIKEGSYKVTTETRLRSNSAIEANILDFAKNFSE